MASLQGTLEQIPVTELNLFHRNARRGDIAAVAKSLEFNGQYKPIVVNRGTHTSRPNEVLAGNHTLQAARQLGWETVEAYVVDVDDAAATRINIVDNRTGQLGGFDDEVLAYLLQGVGSDLSGTGYTEQDYAALIAPLEHVPVALPDFGHEPVTTPEPSRPTTEESTDTAPDEDRGPRNIPLTGLSQRYLAYLAEQLPALRLEMDVETNADVLVMLVMTHTGIRPA